MTKRYLVIPLLVCVISKCNGFPAFEYSDGSVLTPRFPMLRQLNPSGMSKQAEVMLKVFVKFEEGKCPHMIVFLCPFD